MADLHRMTSMLLAERTPPDGRVLVLGAGGGVELKMLAEAHENWTFDGVDPSPDMLHLAQKTVEPYANRVHLYEGYVGVGPRGPYSAATCLLTLHFVPVEERHETLRQIHRRLAPGAPFVVAHISFPQTEPERSAWIARHVAFGADVDSDLDAAKQAIATRLCILSPQNDETMLRAAGFSSVSLFYAALSFRGWVAYA